LIADGLMASDLPYDRITYGYRFAHEEVGELLGGFRRMFCYDLQDIAYDFEYYCTAGELLRVLAERLNPKFIHLLGNEYRAFNAIKIRTMDLLFEYFRSSISSAKAGSAGLAGNPGHNSEFIRTFTASTREIAAVYADIVALIKQNGGERAVRELYCGQSFPVF
jgi:hypothetical protein